MGLFDKFRIWNVFAISKLGYVDQLLTQSEQVQRSIEKVLAKWIGGPNGWLPTESAFHLKSELGFPVAPRRPGAANLAAKFRTSEMLTHGGKNVLRALSTNTLGVVPMG